jgi:uncharacterized protein YjdB
MFIRQQRKFQLLSGLIVILALAPGIGCTGFFVNPTLTSVSVGPGTFTLTQGHTQQMTATGNNNDGTTQDLTSKAIWTTSDSTIATVSSTGLVTAVSPGNATISAASGTVSPGTASVTVTLANILSIAVTPTNSTKNQGETEQFTATATLADGTTHNISNGVSWSLTNSNAGTISATGLFTAASSVTSAEATIVIATSGGTISSPSSGPTAATVTVNP